MDLTSVMDALERHIREEFLDGDASAELTSTSPLLEWGILHSMNTTRLVGFIRERFGVAVPPQQMRSENFRTIQNLAHMVLGLQERPVA